MISIIACPRPSLNLHCEGKFERTWRYSGPGGDHENLSGQKYHRGEKHPGGDLAGFSIQFTARWKYDISLKVKKITPINEDIALNAINNWQLKNLIKDESVELLESEIEEEEAKELLLERIKEHHRQRERQLREALAIRLGKVPSNLFM